MQEKEKKAGRPEIVIDDKIRTDVERLAGLGNTWAEISIELKISESVLKKKCHEDYAKGKVVAGSFVKGQLFKLIKGGHPASIFFYLKTQCGWKETNKTEITGEDGGPIKSEITQLSPAQTAAIAELITKQDIYYEEN